jgi:hypothetical protein
VSVYSLEQDVVYGYVFYVQVTKLCYIAECLFTSAAAAVRQLLELLLKEIKFQKG